ncbi:MAG: hypothetical protein P9M00_03870 [Candidatus Tritonobacter lacicola]|nr:hypothetical protein [Candidatus Tritonobacter lacicola]
MTGIFFKAMLGIFIASLLCIAPKQSLGGEEKIILIGEPDSGQKSVGESREHKNPDNTIKGLKERVRYLEKRVRELAWEIKLLKDSKDSTSASVPPIRQWRMLRIGMPQEKVREIFGEPGRIKKHSSGEYWYYPDTSGGKVSFTQPGIYKIRTVSGWNEP